MRKTLLCALICLVSGILLSCVKEKETVIEAGTASPGEKGYDHRITVEDITFNWSVDGNELRASVRGKTTGWVGAGFNPSAGMKDANFIIGYVKDGVATVRNDHGVSKTLHKSNEDLGGKEHVTNTSVEIKNDETEIRFTIPLKTDDRLDRPINVNGDTVVLLAYGRTTRISQQHAFRVRMHLNLTTGVYSVTLKTRDKK